MAKQRDRKKQKAAKLSDNCHFMRDMPGCLKEAFSLFPHSLRKRLGGRGGDDDARDGLILVKRLFSLENESSG